MCAKRKQKEMLPQKEMLLDDMLRALREENVTFGMSPKLPMVVFKKDNTECHVTDLRLLHSLGVQTFKICLNQMMDEPDLAECHVKYSEDLSNNTFEMIADIVMGISIEVGETVEGGEEFLPDLCMRCVMGVRKEKAEDGSCILVFHPGYLFNHYAYEYKQSHNDDTISLAELAMYIADMRKGAWDYLDSKGMIMRV